MEPISSWSEERVMEWLRGLDAPLHLYPVSEWRLSGVDLLQLTSLDLDKLGVQKVGHQELLLEAVEKLCSLTYGLSGESLRSLTEKLRALGYTLQMGIQARWRRNIYEGRSTTKLSVGVLQLVVELITSAKGLFSLLNRYQFFQLNQNSCTQDIFSSCRQLGDIVHNDSSTFEKEKDIISVCRQLVGLCDDILKSNSELLLSHTAELESVHLVPASPGDPLGIEITSTSSANHYVSGTALEPSADVSLRILAGDEVIQVNEQIVVGWSRANLIKKFKENPDGVTLVLKKVPGSKTRHVPTLELSVTTAQEEEEEVRSEASDEEEDNPRHSIFERVAASVRSLSFRRAVQGPEGPRAVEEPVLPSERSSDRSLSPSHLLRPRSALGVLEGRERTPSPRRSSPGRGSLEDLSSGPEMVGHTGNKEAKKSSTKGMGTALSRRRVSCRELGRPDCDGWLWKKRRDRGVFVTQKWQRFWFILKGPALYWYISQQDVKAEGFINISSYNIESAGEHKRKYVFKMCHSRFQNFFFAGDNVTDMSKWINCMITAIRKHRTPHAGPSNEEECYSETESESEMSPSAGRRNKKVNYNTYPRKRDRIQKSPLPSPTAGGRKSTGPVDEMGQMLNNIKEGGVSLMGQKQPFTHDHFRRSFIKRCKNPVINEKVHTLRALHSTLKAKEAELQQINRLLDTSDLSAETYREWKQHNEELLHEIEKLAAHKAHQSPTSPGGALEAESPGAKTEGALNQCPTNPRRALEPEEDQGALNQSPGGTMEPESPAEDQGALNHSETSPVGAMEPESPRAEDQGPFKLRLCDGEQLVDAEPEGVVSELSHGSFTETSPKLELNLGSLQESINQELSEMAESGETEHYFYI
ncbi:unnamed protein product [Knipowitschia caucasica]